MMMGESHCFFRAVARVWCFTRVMTGNSGSLSCGPREIQFPFELRGVAQLCCRVSEGESVTRCIQEGISRCFSSFSRKPWVPSRCGGDLKELLRVPMRSQGYSGVGRGLSGLHWLWCNGRGSHFELRWELKVPLHLHFDRSVSAELQQEHQASSCDEFRTPLASLAVHRVTGHL